MGHLRLIALLLFFAANASAVTLELFPGSIQVGSTKVDEVGIHRLITGQVKRTGGKVVPEFSDYVRGVKTSETFEIVDVRQTEVVSGFFQDQLKSRGQILFECIGRDCGPSSYWANYVFKESILYGPTEDQHYIFGKLNGDKGDYVIIYLAQRATGKRYARVELISDVSVSLILDSRLIASALRLQSRFVIRAETDETVLTALRDVVNNGDWQRLALVAHNRLQPNETLEAAQVRSKERALRVKAALEEIGTDTDKLIAIGAGPIAPIDRSGQQRLELVVLQ